MKSISDNTMIISQWIPLFTSLGLKIVNSNTKEVWQFPYENEQFSFDWSTFLQYCHDGEQQNLNFTIFLDDEKKLLVKGEKDLLFSLYSQTIGKYIFKKGTEFLELKSLMKDDNCQIRIVINQLNGKQYYEKVILNQVNQDEEFSQSDITQVNDESHLPDEIQIIFDLHRTSTPHILQVNSVFFEGIHFSYIYSRNKDFIRLTQYYNNILTDQKQYFIVDIARQLLQMFVALEDKLIVFPNIHHKSIVIDPESEELIITNYNQAFYCNKIQLVRKCANFGYAPPEYFDENEQITTKADIFQLGALIFYLQFDRTPYGQDSCEIFQNTLNSQLDLTPLKKEKTAMSNFLQLLLQKNQYRRPCAVELLKHKIFLLYPSKLITKSIVFQEIIQDQVQDEFKQFNRISNIQRVKSNMVSIAKK